MLVDAGVTVIDVPFPTDVPPIHEPVYHCQLAEVPNDPPFNVKVDEKPGHTATGDDSADDEGSETVFKVTFAVTHVVEPHVPSALT